MYILRFVCLIIALSKPELKLILTSIIKSKTNESTQVLNAPKLNILLVFCTYKSEGLSKELFHQSNFSFKVSVVYLKLEKFGQISLKAGLVTEFLFWLKNKWLP